MRTERWLAVFVSASVLCSLAGGSNSMDGKFIESLFENKAKEVTAIEATIVRPTEGNSQARTVTLKWDMATDRINARSVVDTGGDRPSVIIMARNSEAEWRGTDMRGKAVEGAYSLDLFPPRQSGLPEQIIETDFNFKWIKHLLVPYHVLQKQDVSPELLDTLDIRITAETGPAGHTIITYRGYVDDRLTGELVYDAEIEDALRIYSMKNFVVLPNGDKYMSVEQSFDQHRKVDGAWIPSLMTEKWYDKAGKEVQSVALEIKQCRINPAFKDEDFVFVPPEGSFVEDRIRGMHYYVGHRAMEGGEDMMFEDAGMGDGSTPRDTGGPVSEDHGDAALDRTIAGPGALVIGAPATTATGDGEQTRSIYMIAVFGLTAASVCAALVLWKRKRLAEDIQCPR